MASLFDDLPSEENRLRLEIQELKEQNAYLTALHETSLGLIDRLDRKELLESILHRACQMTGTEHGYIYLPGPESDEMQMRVGMGFFNGQLGRRVKRGEGMGGKVWEAEGPVLVDDYYTWPGRLTDSSLDTLQSVVGIPLMSGDKVQGVIGLARVNDKKHFGQTDVQTLNRFAQLALIALEKARLYADVKQQLAERKKTEAILRESEERYRSLLESSPDPVVVYDMQGSATYVSPAFTATFGFSPEEVIGKRIDFVPKESLPETLTAIEQMKAGKKINLFETKRFTKRGAVLDVQISSTLYFDRQGRHAGNIVTLRDISALKQTEKELKKYRELLEERVEERTAELARTNLQLQQEIEERKRAEKALRRREKELEAQSHHLEEVNTALKVLLTQRENDKSEVQEHVLSNVKELVSPYVERLKKSRLNTSQTTLVNIMDSNLNNIISPFIRRLSSKYLHFTPMEIRVANLVKEGKTNKEIAELLFLSKNTILFHRHNIRTKLGLKGTGLNLRTHLLSYEN
ncbi:MAG: PAS domain S-box protein [Deltaproteobacteria bacterium]|nr:PAS domain S-box protein [Deltaproteobacteria bacterium]